MTAYILNFPRVRSQKVAFLFVHPFFILNTFVLSVVDLFSLHNLIPSMFVLGDLGIDWTILPALALLFWFRQQSHMKLDLVPFRAVFLGAFFGICLGVFVLFIRTTHHPAEALAYLLLGLKEEAIYRVALPLSLAFLLTIVGMRRKWSFRTAIITSAVIFMTLPGHIQQVGNWPELLVFGAFALIMSYFVWDCGAVIFTGLLHGTMNLVTDMTRQGIVAISMRVFVVFVLIVALTMALPTREETQQNSPDNDDDGVVIDLRDHVLAQQRSDELLKTGN